MEHETILGIDPGTKGGLAFLSPEGGTLDLYDMPTFSIEKPLTAAQKRAKIARFGEDALTKGKSTSSRVFINCPDLAALIKPEPTDRLIKAFIESVSSQPTDGAVQAFSFGRAFGNAEQALFCFDIPTQYVKPQEWKKHFKLTSDKEESRRLATQLMPACAHLWKRVKDADRAEAALIAYWGCLQLGFRMTVPIVPAASCGVLLAA